MSLQRTTRDVAVGMLAAASLVAGSASGLLPFSWIEVAGFVTGGAAVWLLVRENLWTWPIGIVNSGIYVVVFLRARLFADSGLMLLFVLLGFAGWWCWLRGGTPGSRRPIVHAGVRDTALVVMATAAGTVFLTRYLRSIGDAAPLWDALTTCLSLSATYLQARKVIEGWTVWIAADLIYIPLYVAKDLPLTSVLYVVFLTMCVKGALDWRATLRAERGDSTHLWPVLVSAR
jgi:nicotinamide mononucleotide transporter PnuC